ncbi:hypothetical protein IL306_011367 [Fusarium sp. DS 682]|nr:hypothetical protein IL306_011367 [Fusarium sp. DS 682]
MSSEPVDNDTPSEMDIYLTKRQKELNLNSWAKKPEQWDMIRRTCSYSRVNYYFPILCLDGQFTASYWRGPISSPKNLGKLEKLPQDIIVKIATHLDVESFLRFRNVNGKAHSITSQLPEFRKIMRHAPRAVVSLIRTGLSAHVSFGSLYQALTSEKCEICDDFGALLFLPTCTRCCHNCLRKESSMAVVGTEEILMYCPDFPIYGKDNSLKDLIKILDDSAMRTFKVQKWQQLGRVSKKKRGVLADDLLAHPMGKDLSKDIKGLFYKEWLHYRAAACIQFPYLNTSKGVADKGVSCEGCQHAFDVMTDQPSGIYGNSQVPVGSEGRDRCYTKDGFKKHFETCEAAQQLWKDRYLLAHQAESWFILFGGIPFGDAAMEGYRNRYRNMLPVGYDRHF